MAIDCDHAICIGHHTCLAKSPQVAPPPASPVHPGKHVSGCMGCEDCWEPELPPASPEPMPEGHCGDPLCDFDNCGVDEPHTVEKDWQFLVFDAYGQKLLGDGDIAELRALLATQGLHIVTSDEHAKLGILNDPALCWAALEAEMNARGYKFVDEASAKVLEAMALIPDGTIRHLSSQMAVDFSSTTADALKAELARRGKEKRNA